jgi:hypothetical protein
VARTHSAKGERAGGRASGRLRIGDNWNAITIIALSQNNPLKAIAEFVENSIDAHARTITIVRGKEAGEHYLKVVDDGDGIPRDDDGQPSFAYVATHICDSIKRQLKQRGAQGIQGEFGIGLLSFWTVGERLVLASSSTDGRVHQMEMRREEQSYVISPRRSLFPQTGTELVIQPLLPGIRTLSGERIQHYLASELRDRIRRSGVRILIKDRNARKELEVVPVEFTGRHLRELDAVATPLGEVYLELYLNHPAPANQIGLYRSGTRVLDSIARLDRFDREPWTSGYLQGMIDVPFLQLTPGTRDGIIQDASYDQLAAALEPVEEKLEEIIELEKTSEEEEASRTILKSVQRAFKEALLALARDEYDWFDIYGDGLKKTRRAGGLFDEAEGRAATEAAPEGAAVPMAASEPGADRAFYEHPGPLHGAVISPASAVVKVRSEAAFRCIPRDRSRRTVEENVSIAWTVKQGEGELSAASGEIVTLRTGDEPGLTVLEARVRQGDLSCTAESLVTVTDSLIEQPKSGDKPQDRGLPGYTFQRAPAELWRSRFDEKNNLVVINNGHRDYVYASQQKPRKVKYICRLFAKELVLRNFRGFEPAEMLERLVELSLYTEEHLRA